MRAMTFVVLAISSSLALAAEPWPMDAITRNDGKQFRGLLASESTTQLQFVEVVRPPGEPMYLVVHYYWPRAIQEITRINDQQRTNLRSKIESLWKIKSRRRIELGRMEDLVLTHNAKTDLWIGESLWFIMESNTDEELTRRCMVRVEQMFRAFETLFPPATPPTRKLTIELVGSRADYRRELDRRGLDLQNAAVYLPREQRVIAGADLRAYSKRLAEVRQQSRDLLRRQQVMNRGLSEKLTDLAAELKNAGFSTDEIQREVATRRALWKREYESLHARIAQVQRRNEALFNDVAEAMFARLFHEAFHAWIDLTMFPGDANPPRWLHEGLAQIFEGGQLEVGTLRLDAPDKARLQRMLNAFKHDAALPIREIVSADASEFLDSHSGDHLSNRLYLHSWALAWRLFFENEPIDHARLKIYVASKNKKPVERFELLVGESTSKFEANWKRDWLRMGR